jgi:hypothetical protein
MAEIIGHPKVELMVTLALTETEARAFEALAGYGDDNFIKAFYERLGEHYLRPHEKGLRSLFKSVQNTLPGVLARADRARKVFEGAE